MYMDPIFPFEYELNISTGEHIEVSEFDNDQIFEPTVYTILQPLIKRCVLLTREETDSAKLGDDSVFIKRIRSPISGLIRTEPSICKNSKICAMYKSQYCDTKYNNGKIGLFPICWEYQSPSYIAEPHRTSASMIGTAIVQSWRHGRYVIIVHK